MAKDIHTSPAQPEAQYGSQFSFYLAPATQVRYYKEATLADIYHCLRDPKVAKSQTEQLRALLHMGSDRLAAACSFSPDGSKLPAQQAAAWKKRAFHYCTFSGTFGPNRKNDALQHHSGYLCLDFDHLDQVQLMDNSWAINGNSCLDKIRRLLLEDPNFETLLLFTSPSGTGLKWVIPIDLEQCDHLTWFQAVSNYLHQTYQLEADPACKNVSRACFIPYDPDAYIAPRLLPELADTFAANPAVEDLMVTLGATNIVNLAGDTIAAQTQNSHVTE